MAVVITYQNPRKTHVQVQLTTGADTIAGITGPTVMFVACDGSRPVWAAIVGNPTWFNGISNPTVNQPPNAPLG